MLTYLVDRTLMLSNYVKDLVILKFDFQIDLYENKLRKLQEENVLIQVENSTLQSQSTSLLSQINSLQTANVTLETAKRRVRLLIYFSMSSFFITYL